MALSNEQVARALRKALNSSISHEWDDDNIQPSARNHWDGNTLGGKIELIIDLLEDPPRPQSQDLGQIR